MICDGENMSLIYKLERIDFGGVARFIGSHKVDFTVPMALSLYEAHLYAKRKPKRGTAGTVMQHLLFLYSWADFYCFNLDVELFSGRGLELPEIISFSNWLELRSYKGKKLSEGYLSHILLDCKVFVLWFVKRHVVPVENESLNVTIYNKFLAHNKAWGECEISIAVDHMAEDISEESFAIIEQCFRCNCLESIDLSGNLLRNYIMWRLVWEFGLRIGEILALRVQDLHFNVATPYISVVRLEERGRSELDPRSPYQPKVKTLSRDLGFLDAKSSLLGLFEKYIATERTRQSVGNAGTFKSVFLHHDFVFIVHDGSGKPLSISAAQKISAMVNNQSGQRFTWHLGRHAFFNRRYLEASTYPENSHLLDNLIYWGGWKSGDSLKCYTRRATRDVARSGLISYNKKFERQIGEDDVQWHW